MNPRDAGPGTPRWERQKATRGAGWPPLPLFLWSLHTAQSEERHERKSELTLTFGKHKHGPDSSILQRLHDFHAH